MTTWIKHMPAGGMQVIAFTEITPGVVEITTEAFGNLLTAAGYVEQTEEQS